MDGVSEVTSAGTVNLFVCYPHSFVVNLSKYGFWYIPNKIR